MVLEGEIRNVLKVVDEIKQVGAKHNASAGQCVARAGTTRHPNPWHA